MWIRMVFIQKFCLNFRLIFVGLICLCYSYGVIAGQTPELNEKLLEAISRNDLVGAQQVRVLVEYNVEGCCQLLRG